VINWEIGLSGQAKVGDAGFGETGSLSGSVNLNPAACNDGGEKNTYNGNFARTSQGVPPTTVADQYPNSEVWGH
jgi:hypothetical protein